jgi:hypothetical protein
MSEYVKLNLQSMVHFSSVLLILKNELITEKQIHDLTNREHVTSKIIKLFPKELTENLTIDDQGIVRWSIDSSNVSLSVVDASEIK